MKDLRLREGRDLPQITQLIMIEKTTEAGSLDPILVPFPLHSDHRALEGVT